MEKQVKKQYRALVVPLLVMVWLLICSTGAQLMAITANERTDAEVNIPQAEGVSGTLKNQAPGRGSFNYLQDLTIPYRWEEPLQGATRIAFSYSGVTNVNLGFNFDFYDSTYSSINLFTHGYASFDSTYSTTSNPTFPMASSNYQKMVAPLWDYVYYYNAGPTSGIYYKSLSNPDRFVVTWYKTPFRWNGGTSDFQAVLYKDSGNILFNYKSLAGLSSPTVGLNDGDGTYFNMPYHNNPTPASSQSIVFGIMDNDVGVEELVSPASGTRVRPNAHIYLNVSIINYGFTIQNGIPVDITITSGAYEHTDSAVLNGNMPVMVSREISFQWTVPDHENWNYVIEVETKLASDEVVDGNLKQFGLVGETFYDVGVWEINRIPGQWYPHMEIDVNARVANWGNIDANLTLTMDDGAGFTATQNVPTLESGEKEGVLENYIENVTFQWRPAVIGEYTLTFTTFNPDDENPANNVATLEKTIYVSPYDVRLAYNNTIMKKEPGQAMSILFTVYNDGDKRDDIELSVLEYPLFGDWTIPLFDHNVIHNLGKESSRQVSMVVAIPPSAMAGPQSIKVLASSLGDGVTNSTLTFPIEVLPDPGVKVESPEGQFAEPGSSVVYNFTITNTGNSVDSFSVSIRSSNHWDCHLLNYSITPELIPLTDQDSYVISVKLIVPEDALHGSTDILTVTASSMENINVQSSAHIATGALQKYDVEIKSTYIEYKMNTERDVWISFNVTNIGNGKDDTITFSVEHPPGWVTYVDTSKLHGGLPRLYWGQVYMRVRAPLGTANDVFPLVVYALAGEVSEVKDSFTFYFEILPEYGVNISSPQPHRQAYNGEEVEFEINVKNVGNTYEAFNVSCVSENIYFRYQGITLVDLWLNANETQTIQAFIVVPQDWGADQDPSTTEMESYRFKIMVMYSISPMPITDEMYISLTVLPEYNHTIMADSYVLDIPQVKGATSSDYQFHIKNNGNLKDIVFLEFENAFDGPVSANLRTETLMLSMGEVEDVVLTVEVGANAALGDYNIILRSSSNADGSILNYLNLTVSIVDYDFTISKMTIDGITYLPGEKCPLVMGQEVSLTTTISNIGSESFVGKGKQNLTIDYYLGNARIKSYEFEDVVTDNSRIFSFTRIFVLNGQWPLKVVLNENGVLPDTDVENNVFEMELDVSVPSIVGSEGDEAGSGTSFTFFVGGIVVISILLLLTIFIFGTIVRKGRFRAGYDEGGQYRPDLDAESNEQIKINLDDWEDLYDDEDLDELPIKTISNIVPGVTGNATFPGAKQSMPQPTPQPTRLSLPETKPLTKPQGPPQTDDDLDATLAPSPEFSAPDDEVASPMPVTTKPSSLPSTSSIPRATTRPVSTKPLAADSPVALPVATTRPVSTKPLAADSPVALPVATTRPVSTKPLAADSPVALPVATTRPVSTKPLAADSPVAIPVATTRPVSTKPLTADSSVAIPVSTTRPVGTKPKISDSSTAQGQGPEAPSILAVPELPPEPSKKNNNGLA